MSADNLFERDTGAAASGKLSPEALERSVFSLLGAPRGEVLIGPAVGEDAAVINWPRGKLLVFASDPIVGASRGAGRLLVRVNANDIATKGGEPLFIAVTLIFPPSMGEGAVASAMREIHEECAANGIAIVGGHTELNDMYSRPVLCASLIGAAERVFSASDVKEGDAIYASKHIGIEGMAILASDRPDLLEGFFTPGEIREIEGWMEHTSVLEESRILREYASFMHDPTEGGFMGGVWEMCRLAGLSADISGGAPPIHPYTRRASEALGFDPLRLVASGSMLATVPEKRVPAAEAAFSGLSVEITRVGTMAAPGAVLSAGAEAPEIYEELWLLLKKGRLTD
ncbi:MAG: hydrogenase expression protein [Synergistaceae bacterium]|jgi:hydrogenase maturation factor|nr:hydrogenase expression protein [Synergistaceae bacterium]